MYMPSRVYMPWHAMLGANMCWCAVRTLSAQCTRSSAIEIDAAVKKKEPLGPRHHHCSSARERHARDLLQGRRALPLEWAACRGYWWQCCVHLQVCSLIIHTCFSCTDALFGSPRRSFQRTRLAANYTSKVWLTRRAEQPRYVLCTPSARGRLRMRVC